MYKKVKERKRKSDGKSHFSFENYSSVKLLTNGLVRTVLVKKLRFLGARKGKRYLTKGQES